MDYLIIYIKGLGKNHAFQEMMTSTCDPDEIFHTETEARAHARTQTHTQILWTPETRARTQQKGGNLPFSHVVPIKISTWSWVIMEIAKKTVAGGWAQTNKRQR